MNLRKSKRGRRYATERRKYTLVSPETRRNILCCERRVLLVTVSSRPSDCADAKESSLMEVVGLRKGTTQPAVNSMHQERGCT